VDANYRFITVDGEPIVKSMTVEYFQIQMENDTPNANQEKVLPGTVIVSLLFS